MINNETSKKVKLTAVGSQSSMIISQKTEHKRKSNLRQTVNDDLTEEELGELRIYGYII